MKLRSAHMGVVCLGILASVAAGCAEEREPVSRVQPNAMEKAFFVGPNIHDPADDPEFRMKAFNVGGTVGQDAYSIGEYSALDRIRWEITENFLIGRKAYEIAPGADNRGTEKVDWDKNSGNPNLVKTPNGTIVAAYKILSHFDIRRDYNTVTGEELNVVNENTTDRPWFDREFIRVDWTMNVADGPNDPTRWFSDRFGGKATPVAYSASSQDADDAPHVDQKDGYFDVTNKFTVEPEEMQFPWGSIKKCQLVSFLTGSSTYDCNAQEAVVRLSFAKVKDTEDFERFEDTYRWHDVVGNMGGDGDAAQTSFGGAPRQGFDPQYGYTDALTRRFKNIHEMFVASHQQAKCTADDDANNDGTADQCDNGTTGYKGHAGSRCDIYVGKCTLPVRDREVKTIGYFFNNEAPAEIQDQVDANGKMTSRGTLEELTYSWNQMLSVALAYRREVECRSTGDGDRDTCHAQFFEGTGPESKEMVAFGNWLVDKVKPQASDKGKPVLSACHNPVRAYDPQEACGDPGTKARLGDQRKNFIVYWPFDSRAHYGGVAGVTPDPVTGEIRGASATIMGRSATYAAAMQRDIIQLALGDLNIEQLMDGVPAQRYVNTVRSGALAPPGFTKPLTQEEMQHRIALVKPEQLRVAMGVSEPTGTSDLARAMVNAKRAAVTTTSVENDLAGIAKFDALSSKLRTKAPEVETKMVDSRFMRGALGADFIQGAMGQNGTGNVTPDLLKLASPIQGLDPMRVEAMRSLYAQQLGDRGACFHDGLAAGPGSVYLASLAGYFKQKYGDLDPIERGKRIYDDLWKEAIKGIGLHEIGHSLGLRHNFASSWDAQNYNPQYWQLRTNEGQSTKACDGPRNADGPDSCMGPRYVDPMTVDEQGLGSESRPSVDYFANTSTMEYQIERFGETSGLGTYDLHSMKALYGRVLETFDDRVVPLAQQKNFNVGMMSQLGERNLVLSTTNGTVTGLTAHYTEVARRAKLFDKARDCRPATEDEKAHGLWRIVHGQVCSPPPKDHQAFGAFTSESFNIAPGWDSDAAKWHAKDRDGKDHIRWNYRYGEEYGSGGHFHTQPGDAGADPYEVVQNLERRFELTYPWAYFRRGNREYMSMNLPQSVASQYFSRARGYHWNVAISLGNGSQMSLDSDDGNKPYAMAQTELASFLQKAVLTPEPGTYASSPSRTIGSKSDIFDILENDPNGSFTIGIGDGRYIGDQYDDTLGGSWDYLKYPKHAGFEVEKALAMMQLIDPRPTLYTIARENFLDERNVYISFRTDLPDVVDQIVGGLLAEDWESIAPAVVDTASAAVVPADLTHSTADRPKEQRVLFPNIGYTQQVQMAVFAAIFSRLGSDMNVVDKMRLWVDGDKAPVVPGARVVSFVDPTSGFTYNANRFEGTDDANKQVDRGIASRMLTHANQLMIEAYQVKRDAQNKPILDATGKPELILGSNGLPQTVDAGRAANLKQYIGLMAVVRQIGNALGNGPLGGASGGGDDE